MRAPNSERQQRRTASITASAPRMFRKVSFIPAKEVAAVSSAVAEERTATGASGVLAYQLLVGGADLPCSGSGIGVASNSSRAAVLAA